MCGIVGILRWTGAPVAEAEIRRLTDAMVYRGPDDEGVFVDGAVGLGMRRLSIIDLSGSRQPMSTADGRLTIVFNGEIYNFRDVRAELEALGHRFATNGDTEVILTGYRQWGPGVLDRLNGMWGLAIWDRERRELFLARDRLGKKQIYYTIAEGQIVFGSEMATPLMAGSQRRLRLDRLAEFLTYSYVAGADTAVDDIHLLPEAHWAIVAADGSIRLNEYWSYAVPDGKPMPPTSDRAAEEAYALLIDAVRLRLVSDVPVSVMLSSGLDSSSLAYVLARELDAPLRTFSLGYDDAGFDESIDAGAFARRLGMNWQRQVITGADVAAAFPGIVEHGSSLQSNTAQIVYYFVNRMIHEAGFKVALNGSGGDELFAGYPTYRADMMFHAYRRAPVAAKSALRRWIQSRRPSLGRVSYGYALRKFTECPYDSPLRAHAYWRTIFSEPELRGLLSPSAAAAMSSFTRGYDAAYADLGISEPGIMGSLKADMRAWLIPMQPWVDNMSMAHSIELRLPYLDHRLVHRAYSLPAAFQFRGWKLKRLMKRYLKGRLPPDVLHRRKRGTHLPVGRWLNGELAPICDHYLGESVIGRTGLFDTARILNLVDDHRGLRADNTFKLWTLITLSAWMERYGISA